MSTFYDYRLYIDDLPPIQWPGDPIRYLADWAYSELWAELRRRGYGPRGIKSGKKFEDGLYWKCQVMAVNKIMHWQGMDSERALATGAYADMRDAILGRCSDEMWARRRRKEAAEAWKREQEAKNPELKKKRSSHKTSAQLRHMCREVCDQLAAEIKPIHGTQQEFGALLKESASKAPRLPSLVPGEWEPVREEDVQDTFGEWTSNFPVPAAAEAHRQARSHHDAVAEERRMPRRAC